MKLALKPEQLEIREGWKADPPAKAVQGSLRADCVEKLRRRTQAIYGWWSLEWGHAIHSGSILSEGVPREFFNSIRQERTSSARLKADVGSRRASGDSHPFWSPSLTRIGAEFGRLGGFASRGV